jgi:hypothetical protein
VKLIDDRHESVKLIDGRNELMKLIDHFPSRNLRAAATAATQRLKLKNKIPKLESKNENATIEI